MKKNILLILIIFGTVGFAMAGEKPKSKVVPENVMQKIYQEIQTPYKYGLVRVPKDDSEKMDCPSIFRKNNRWLMTYLIFNGRGYETCLAESDDLLHWKTQGRIMSFSADRYPLGCQPKGGLRCS